MSEMWINFRWAKFAIRFTIVGLLLLMVTTINWATSSVRVVTPSSVSIVEEVSMLELSAESKLPRE
jgi:hypothetical protein